MTDVKQTDKPLIELQMVADDGYVQQERRLGELLLQLAVLQLKVAVAGATIASLRGP
jgi:hypothetical protein